MPFVKKSFFIPKPTKAFLFVMDCMGFTQAQAQRHISKGRLLKNGKPMKSSSVVEDEVEMLFFQPIASSHTPLFQTDNFMVFEKPSGLLVHPNYLSTEYTLLDAIRYFGGNHSNATHRIDMETSGLVLASKHKKSEVFLKQAFENRHIVKRYLAWVDGKVDKPFKCEVPLKVNCNDINTKHRVVVDKAGKDSLTEFTPLQYDKGLDTTLVLCAPRTGRLHQIRAHLFHVKHPILGDPIYGATYDATEAYLDRIQSKEERSTYHGALRLLLHAQSLSFTHKQKYYIESKLNFTALKSLITPKEKRIFNRGLN
jgi:23S rRNA pseudouridine1911/1915/1917 synthase